MPRRRPTPPAEALRQLQEAQSRPFWRTPSLRLSLASVMLLMLMWFFENKLNLDTSPPKLAADISQKFATAADLDNATQYFTRAQIYLEHHRPGEAVSDYNHVLRQTPDSFLALQGRAQAYLRLGEPQLALADFTQALAVRPDAMTVLNNRALVYMQLNQPEAALADYDRALELQPDSALLHANRGLVWAALDKPTQALQDFRQAQSLNPDYAPGFFFEGNQWLKQSQYERAERAYVLAVRRDPELAEAWHNLGLSRKHQGRCEAARQDFQQACELDYAPACAQKCR